MNVKQKSTSSRSFAIWKSGSDWAPSPGCFIGCSFLALALAFLPRLIVWNKWTRFDSKTPGLIWVSSFATPMYRPAVPKWKTRKVQLQCSHRSGS